MPPSTSSEQLPRNRFFLRRVFLSTWLVMLLACGVLFLLEVPGRRTGLTTYAHGWPLAFLERDYRQDVTMLAAGNHTPAGTVGSDAQYLEQMTPRWERDGLPWELESRFSPWSLDNTTGFSILRCVADLLFVGLCMLAVGWMSQRRRRIRGSWLQFRLRGLLAAVALLGILFALIKNCVVDRREDEETAAALLQEIGHTQYQYPSDPLDGMPPRDRGIVLEYGWDPPGWLPESVLKIGGFRDLFRRVHGVLLVDDPKIDDAALERIAKLRQVRSLELASVGVTERGFPALERFDRLTELTIAGGAISETGIASIVKLPRLERLDLFGVKADDSTFEQLSQIRSLTELTLRGRVVGADGAILDPWPDSPIGQPKAGDRWIHAAGIRQLLTLPHLKSLTFEHQRLTDDAVEAINELSGLESLNLDPVVVAKIALHGLGRLKVLSLDSRPNSASVELRDLPALEQLDVFGSDDAAKPQTLVLRGVANLVALDVGDVSLDEPSWEEIHGSKRLVLLFSDRFPMDKNGTWQLRGFPLVSDVEICHSPAPQLEISEMPALERLRFSYNHAAKWLRFNRLPNLSQLVLEGNAQLSGIHFAGTPQLRTIGLEFIRENSKDESKPQQISMPGLASLTNLEKFDGDSFPFSAESLRDLGQLSHLSSLTLRSTEFDDRGLASLKGLVHLTELRLDDTSITDAGLPVISGMKNLESLDLVGTKVSAAGVAGLQRQFPKLKIDWYPTRQP